MKKQPIINLLLGVILTFTLVLFASCGSKTQGAALKNIETSEYTHITGYQLTVPANWQPVAQTTAGVYFVDELNHISLNVVSEIGGMDFLSLEEMSVLIKDKFSAGYTDVEELAVIKGKDEKKEYGLVLKGMDGVNPVIADIWIYEPYNSIRYYLIFSCGGDDYQNNTQLFKEITGSFNFVSDKNQVYEMLNLSAEEFDKSMKDGLHKI